jgi:hypothetical protein
VSLPDRLVLVLLPLVLLQLMSHQLQLLRPFRSRLSITPSPLRSYTPLLRPYFPPLPLLCADSGAAIAARAAMPTIRLMRLLYPSPLIDQK